MGSSEQPPESDFSLHPDHDRARADAERLFERIAAELRRTLPASADIRHIGATAVPGCLTKGDLDIVVRVAAEDFCAADAALAARFARNVGSKRSESFSSFEDGSTSPHLGIQLTTAGGEDDYFHLFVDALRQDPELVTQYNALKRDFDGQPMDIYRAAKSAFVTRVLSRLGG
ncbi:MAG: GrpB family protein [Rhizobiales bacterium]|nr:GrpB family protein [Hyphomicrobiales bacterium]